MGTNALNIILTLDDKASAAIVKAGKNLEDFGRTVDRVGTRISRMGLTMSAVGTTMITPFVAAAKSMEKYSFEAQQQISRLNNEFLNLSKVMTEAALPTIRQFNDNFSRVINYLNSLDPILLQNVAHWTMVSGAILVAAGALELFIGRLISLAGKILAMGAALATWSGGLIPGLIAVIGGLIFAWLKFHDEFVLVIDSLKFLWLQFCDALMAAWQKFLQVISKVPGANSFQRQVDELTIARQKIKQEMNALASGENSDWSKGANNFAQTITNQIQKMQASFQKTSNQINTVMVDMHSRIVSLAYDFSDKFASAFDNILFEGGKFSDNMKNLFKSMGRDILRDFVSTVGKNLFGSLLGVANQQSGAGIGGALAASLGGGGGGGWGSILGILGTVGMMFLHTGGIVRAHSGLATDEVPIIAQTGEGILSRKGMAALGASGFKKLNAGEGAGGKGGMTVIVNQVVKAWDASDVYRNRQMLTAAIADDIKSNGKMRQTMNNYR